MKPQITTYRTTAMAFMMFFSIFIVRGQFQEPRIPLPGDKAPAFEGASTMGMINFPGDFFGKWKIVFSHAADFTPVCTSEMIRLAAMQTEFEKLNCELIGVSTDDLDTHRQWLSAMDEILVKENGNHDFDIPLVADTSLDISMAYGMIRVTDGGVHPVRATYIIDPQNKIRAMFFYPYENGRNLDEVMRTLVAIQKTDRFNVLTPENWHPGEDILIYGARNERESRKQERLEKRGVIECSGDYYCVRSSR